MTDIQDNKLNELKQQCERIKSNKHPLYDETWAEYADKNDITYDKEDEKSCRNYIKSYETWYSAKSENENNNNNSGNGDNNGNNQSERNEGNNQRQQEEKHQNNSDNKNSNNNPQQDKPEHESLQSNSITKEEHNDTINFTSFGKTLDSSDKQEAFLINELNQMNEICREDKLLSSLVSPDLNVSIRVVHDDKKQAPIYDDMSKSLIYHQQIVENQMNNKGKNGINYYTQSSLFHELVHAEQIRTGLKPAQMKMAGKKPCFVVENAYDLMGIEAECKMLNAMYHIKAWQKEGKSLVK